MKALERCYKCLGIPATARIQEVRSAFKKKSSSLHPDKHPGNPNAFAQFNEVNEAFVEIVKDFENRAMQTGSEDPEVATVLEKCEDYVPGEVDVKGNGIAIKIQHYKLWKKVLRQKWPDAVIGAQRKNSISALKQQVGGKNKGTRMIIRFKLKGGSEDNLLKVNVSIYENDNLIVTGPSYFLWTLDNYKDLSGQVQKMWEEQFIEAQSQKSEQQESEEPTSAADCQCSVQYVKLEKMLKNLDEKVTFLNEQVDLVTRNQTKFNSITNEKYSSLEEKLEQIAGPCDSGQSDGGKTYVVARPDKFEELKSWFKDFCEHDLPGLVNQTEE